MIPKAFTFGGIKASFWFFFIVFSGVDKLISIFFWKITGNFANHKNVCLPFYDVQAGIFGSFPRSAPLPS